LYLAATGYLSERCVDAGSSGGFSKWAKFYEHHREARDKLMALGAVPTATVSPLKE
jgi:hypothetical protein